ncbi:aminotransferase class I/II-fold pyridoxal phosphate-dependent enzyme, partial [Paenibacillus algorifonticola]|uniref:aminotransferase class I/II-fold pyridoxal phosphate-dependent enzyme n=1 Tax=Paenibacillus algorifonticola TaxID=684063 RepID=UPI003D2CB0C8
INYLEVFTIINIIEAEPLFDWIFSVKSKQGLGGKPPAFFISDWDLDFQHLHKPQSLIDSIFDNSKNQVYQYNLSDDVHELPKSIVLSHIEELNYNIENIAICSNGTSAIHSALTVLSKNVKNFLLLSPTYFLYPALLRYLDCQITHCAYDGHENFDFDSLKKLLETKEIEAIILIDPIFSMGRSVPIEFYSFIANCCVELNIWLLVDNMYGCCEWNSSTTISNIYFNLQKLEIIARLEKHIYIDSITKRVGLNGNKVSMVFSSPSFIRNLESYSLYVTGSFCITQINLINEFYSADNQAYLTECIHKNIENAMNHYNLIQSIIQGSAMYLSKTDSGYFTCLHIPKVKLGLDNEKDIFNFLLDKAEIITLPTSLFHYSNDEYYSFRVNLLADKAKLFKSINRLRALFP